MCPSAPAAALDARSLLGHAKLDCPRCSSSRVVSTRPFGCRAALRTMLGSGRAVACKPVFARVFLSSIL
eukprot:9545598-Alexandrium_andersonii.AAC.1